MRLRALLALAGAACLLAGCASTVDGQPTAEPKAQFPSSASPSSGSAGGKSGAQIITQTFHLMNAATAFRAKAVGVDDTGAKVSLDVHFGAGSAEGTIQEGGFGIQVIVVPGAAYFKGDDAFWRNVIPGSEQSTVLPKMRGKWVTGPLSNADFAGIAGTFTRTSLIQSLTEGHPASGFSVIGSGTHGGVSVIRLKDTSDGSEVDVRATGQPFPVYSVTPVTSADGGGTVDFSEWNVPFTAHAPPKSQTFDATRYLH